MTDRLAKRVDALEGKEHAGTGAWHRLTWGVGQSWDSVLSGYGPDNIRPGDNVIVFKVVAPTAEGLGPAPDPIRKRDELIADAWFAARRVGVGSDSLRVNITKTEKSSMTARANLSRDQSRVRGAALKPSANSV